MSIQSYLTGKLSEEEIKESIQEHSSEYYSLVTERILPQMAHLMKLIYAVKPSKQVQLSLQDLESINLHMINLIQHGPKTPLEEIPLEESEVEEDFEFETDEEKDHE